MPNSVENTPETKTKELGFIWWQVFNGLWLLGFAALIVKGNFSPLFFFLGAFFWLFLVNYSRAAFILATIFTLNPIFWIINGIYIKNRWNHPKVVGGSTVADTSESDTSTDIKPMSLPQNEIILDTDRDVNRAYEIAADELNSEKKDKGLWARLFAESDGDENKTKARYINERAAQISKK